MERRSFLRSTAMTAVLASQAGLTSIFGKANVFQDQSFLPIEVSKKLQLMWDASWESIRWRQDKYKTGGIVESDERVDGGRKLYWPWCWPRNFIVEPMLAVKEYDRVRRYLEFWAKCQHADGAWYRCYDVRDYKPYDKLKETDNVGYMLINIASYMQATEDKTWLIAHRDMVLHAGDYLCGLFNPEYDLIYGVEEARDVDEKGNVIDLPSGYSTHINTVCAKGLHNAATLAAQLGRMESAKKFHNTASRVEKAIEDKLYDEKRGQYLLGLTDNGQPQLGTLWFKLMPGYVPLLWNKRVESTFWKLWESSYNLDPKIPGGYWGQDFRPMIENIDFDFKNSAGKGPYIGVSAAIAHLLLLGGEEAKARQQIEFFTRFTNDSHLIAQNLCTFYAGRDYSMYPNGQYWVDSGNLFHLSFFLRLAMHYPDKLGISI